jgi:hypothetical protein
LKLKPWTMYTLGQNAQRATQPSRSTRNSPGAARGNEATSLIISTRLSRNVRPAQAPPPAFAGYRRPPPRAAPGPAPAPKIRQQVFRADGRAKKRPDAGSGGASLPV